MRLPEEKIEEIRRLANIVDIVSDYVSLQPAGKSYKARSPFTNEKTPSFFVSPEKQIYKCFSSGKGGNVFTFVMEMEKVGFIDAVKIVAKKVGIDLSQYEQSPQAGAQERIEYDVMRFAAKFFHQALTSPEGKPCLDYFKSRGLSTATISHFGLGYAYNDWDRLICAAQKANFSLELLSQVGLAAYSDKSQKHYDAFRHRAMFPVFSPAGKVVGFAGRLLGDEKDAPKYINSPESKLYEKSKLLYAMNFAKDEIRKKGEAILVEGYMDAIALHQAGICHSVASSGTALTSEQVRLISRYAKQVIFLYDGDRAGIAAMLRGIDVMLEQGITPNIVTLPDGHDPDSFVREFGAAEISKFIAAHQTSFLDFKLHTLEQSGTLSDPQKFRAALTDLVTMLLKLPDELSQEIYFKTLAQKLDISLSLLQREKERELAERKKKPVHSRAHRASADAKPESTGTAGSSPPSSSPEKLSVVERTFLKAFLESLLHGSAVIEFVASHLALFHFRHPLVKSAVEFILARYHRATAQGETTLDLPSALAYIDQPELRDFISGLLMEPPISERWPQESSHQHARRCLQAFFDATSKLILERYDTVLKENLARLQNGLSETEQIALLEERKVILARRQEAKREFDLAAKFWLN
ncbi:MAG: DNA primase [Candidatus Thermochlorobacter sp.]